jgi:hypothetical protein
MKTVGLVAALHAGLSEYVPGQRAQGMQQQQVGYPRVVGGYIAGGYHPGVGYVVGADGQPVAMLPPAPPAPPGFMQMPHQYPVAPHSAPWRPMQAPGSPPLGEGHVTLPMNPETNQGVWGSTATGGAATGATIIFSARPQKPFKLTRIIVGSAKTAGATAAHLVGQQFVGTDLQQGEVGNVDLESIGAGGSFDTWLSFKQAEPGVWIRIFASLLGAPTFTSTTDTATYILTAIGHYLH